MDSATDQGKDEATLGLFRRLFTRLVTLGEGAEDTRRTVGREELGPDAWALAQKLADEDNRLVVTAAVTPGQETAEVVHEALIRNWPALADWVNRDRGFQTWLRGLKPRVDEWRTNGSDPVTLLRGGPLAVAEDWVSKRGGDCNAEEREFVGASVAMRDAEHRQAEEELKKRQAQVKQVADAQERTALAQKEREVALERTARAQRWLKIAYSIVGLLFLFALFLTWLIGYGNPAMDHLIVARSCANEFYKLKCTHGIGDGIDEACRSVEWSFKDICSGRFRK